MQDWSPKELEEHLARGEKVFLKLWKKGCGACNLSTPALVRIETANQHGLIFGQISSDDHPEMLEIADTDVLPAFFIFVDGKIRGQMTGFKGLEKLTAFIDEAMATVTTA